MAVTIPPWLNIDPLAPARIALAANSRRAANAAAERRAALEEQRLYMQQEAMYARIAAQERADQRREQVLRQTRDAQLAQQAAALQFRREMGLRQSAQQMQALRLREQQAEQKIASAARQLQGMRQLEQDLKSMPLEEALKKNAGNLFADRPDRLAAAMKSAAVPGAPQEFTTAGGLTGVFNPRTGAPSFPPRTIGPLGDEAYTARDIVDKAGNPTGIKAIPGKGAARVLSGNETVSPRDRMRGLIARLAAVNKQILFESDTPEQEKAFKEERDDIKRQLKELTDLPAKAAGKEHEMGEYDEEGQPSEEDFGLPPVDMNEEGGDEEDLPEDTGDEDFSDEDVQDEDLEDVEA